MMTKIVVNCATGESTEVELDKADLAGLPTQATLEEYQKAQEKINAQLYLNSTDWVNSKYADVVVMLGTMTKEEFMAKYAEVYTKREIARQVINGEVA